MPKTTHHSATATAYARSLLEVANEQQQAQQIADEMNGIAAIVAGDPMLRLFFDDPAIGSADRKGVVERSFGAGQVSKVTSSFLKILADRGALNRIEEIAGAFNDLLEAQQGKVEVDVTTAHRLSAAELEAVRQRISAALKRDAVVHQYVDEKIIGGLVIRVGDQLIDGSVKAQLESMREQLLASRPR